MGRLLGCAVDVGQQAGVAAPERADADAGGIFAVRLEHQAVARLYAQPFRDRLGERELVLLPQPDLNLSERHTRPPPRTKWVGFDTTVMILRHRDGATKR